MLGRRDITGIDSSDALGQIEDERRTVGEDNKSFCAAHRKNDVGYSLIDGRNRNLAKPPFQFFGRRGQRSKKYLALASPHGDNVLERLIDRISSPSLNDGAHCKNECDPEHQFCALMDIHDATGQACEVALAVLK